MGLAWPWSSLHCNAEHGMDEEVLEAFGSNTGPDWRWHDMMQGEHCSHVSDEPVSMTMA
jgi:hypothetical protein